MASPAPRLLCKFTSNFDKVALKQARRGLMTLLISTKDKIMTTTPNQISTELQARIDALADGNLKTDIIRAITRPGTKIATSEEVFDSIAARYAKATAERTKWRIWHDNEVLAFVEHFKQEMSDDYAEYLRQERDNKEIETELSWRVSQLAYKWIPDLTYADNGNLLGKVRDHLQAQVRAMGEELP